MKTEPSSMTWALAFILIFHLFAHAEMASENYRIKNSVHSGGGTATTSDNYQMNSTLGQSSPPLDPADPPFSESYDLYPGFWYTVMGPKCEGDYDGDGDVDGSDSAAYVAGDLSVSLEEFAQDFGKANCPQ